MPKIGIIAGNGQMPLLTAKRARGRGYEVIAVALREETDAAIDAVASSVTWIALTQIGALIRAFVDAGVTEAVMAGQVAKRRMYFTDLLKADAAALRLWSKLPDKKGVTIMKAVADELAANGVTLIDSTAFLTDLLADPGVMTRKTPSAAAQADIAFGARMARIIADHDIGQSIAVKDRSVVAVEGMEGTDRCIQRAGELSGGGFTLIKVAMKNQDMRFDVPVAGIGTVGAMKQAGGAVLAVEAGRTLMLDKDRLIEDADAAGIGVVGITPEIELARG